jgi:hypothetical protein
MTPAQYTDDAVCFAMGLGRFVPANQADVVRLVCRPSFHPEVCVTLTPREIVTVALRSMLWQEPVPARMPEFSEVASLLSDEFAKICNAFDSALEESEKPPKWVVICDGMSASAVRVRAGRVERFMGHCVNEAERGFVTAALSLALARTRSVHLRNRISWCGRYVNPRDDQAFPVAPEPDFKDPQVTRLLVLGTPQDRADFHAMFRTKPAARPPI